MYWHLLVLVKFIVDEKEWQKEEDMCTKCMFQLTDKSSLEPDDYIYSLKCAHVHGTQLKVMHGKEIKEVEKKKEATANTRWMALVFKIHK